MSLEKGRWKMEPRYFQEAVQAARSGDRATAYQLIRQVLLDNPNFAPAWLWMSGLVDDVRQQRDCLERVLALDPANTQAREGLELLRLRDLLSAAPSRVVQPEPKTRQIGDYLVE